jgi:hypothetical protein
VHRRTCETRVCAKQSLNTSHMCHPLIFVICITHSYVNDAVREEGSARAVGAPTLVVLDAPTLCRP